MAMQIRYFAARPFSVWSSVVQTPYFMSIIALSLTSIASGITGWLRPWPNEENVVHACDAGSDTFILLLGIVRRYDGHAVGWKHSSLQVEVRSNVYILPP